MTDVPTTYNADGVRDAIFAVRGEKVILDADLAAIYGVPIKVLNQAVKRNADKFPPDFMFHLTAQEVEEFEQRYGDDPNGSSQHRQTGEDGRWRKFSASAIAKRDYNSMSPGCVTTCSKTQTTCPNPLI